MFGDVFILLLLLKDNLPRNKTLSHFLLYIKNIIPFSLVFSFACFHKSSEVKIAIKESETSLSKILGTKVKIKESNGKGKIEISYYSYDIDKLKVLKSLKYPFRLYFCLENLFLNN